MEHSPTGGACRTRKQNSHQFVQAMADHNAAVYTDPSVLAPVSVGRGRPCMHVPSSELDEELVSSGCTWAKWNEMKWDGREAMK
eukprot:scaffold574937_cov17-Prasinocladus_malaysianus.AAC.1